MLQGMVFPINDVADMVNDSKYCDRSGLVLVEEITHLRHREIKAYTTL